MILGAKLEVGDRQIYVVERTVVLTDDTNIVLMGRWGRSEEELHVVSLAYCSLLI